MRACVDVCLGPQAQRGRCGEHHRREQHDRGVQAEDCRDDGRDDEYADEQPRGTSAGRPRHCHAAGGKYALVVAQLGQHKHRGEEADHRAQPSELGAGILPGDRANRNDNARGRYCDHGLGPAFWANHRERQHAQKQTGRQHLGCGAGHPVGAWLMDLGRRELDRGPISWVRGDSCR